MILFISNITSEWQNIFIVVISKKKIKGFWYVDLSKAFEFGLNLDGFYKWIIKHKMDACNIKNIYGFFFFLNKNIKMLKQHQYLSKFAWNFE